MVNIYKYRNITKKIQKMGQLFQNPYGAAVLITGRRTTLVRVGVGSAAAVLEMGQGAVTLG